MALLIGAVAVMARELRAARVSAERLDSLDAARMQRDAECEAAARRVDALLGVVASVHLHAQAGANHFDKAASMYDGSHWLLPIFSEAQFGASRMRAIERTTAEVLRLTQGDHHGRQR